MNKVKPFYIRITDDMTPQMVKDAFGKCHSLGVRASNNDDIENLFDWGYFGVCAKDGTYFSDSYRGFYDATEITLDQLDEWLGLETEQEWKSGDECVINRTSTSGELLSDIGTYYGETDSHYWLHGIGGLDSSDKGGNIYCKSKYWLSKPETPQQREERERLEAAYDLYCNSQHAVDVIGYDSFGVFKSDKVQVKFWLSIVDKTGYRKAK